jgi:threonine/homoserine/homoserine lactone efflux protein
VVAARGITASQTRARAPSVRGVLGFLLVALVVTLTPGPGTAMILRVAARDGRRAALGAVAGNSAGILVWAGLSALGVSSLILASRVAYDVLRVAGAAVLVVLGLRSLLRRRRGEEAEPASPPRRLVGWKLGVVTSLSNPKVAVFFVALLPQFLSPGTAVLPAALAMAAVIVALDVVWFSTLAYLVERAGRVFRPRIRGLMERLTGTVLVGLGVRLATESR